jgi:hypothetical protein
VIPPGGFLPQGLNTTAEMLNDFLPVAFEGTYVDSTKKGKPHDVIGAVAGFSEVALKVSGPTKLFTVTLRQRGTHGLALIDRIE